ncbi:MAG: VWA domain-containing protein [Acidobacteria bacterium]|nr:VWA domain-containing protein [Acidobacteriota bacterium]
MRAAFAFRLALIPALAACVAAAGARDLLAQAGVRERTIFVSAVDGRGDPVDGLGLPDFIVTEDGRRREVLRVSPAVEPIDIALLVDNSASAERAISSIRDGVRGFVTQMAVGNQIALVALADRPTILVDYTSSPERLAQGTGRLFAMNGSGMTLLDAILEVSAGLRRREAPRAVIVPVITNGVEFTNRYARDVIAAVRGAGAALHAIVVGHLPIGTTEERERAMVLDAGTRETGGQHVTLLTESAIEQALLRLARELTSQYKVVYGRPESLIPPDKIEVRSARPGVTMRGAPMRGQAGA